MRRGLTKCRGSMVYLVVSSDFFKSVGIFAPSRSFEFLKMSFEFCMNVGAIKQGNSKSMHFLTSHFSCFTYLYLRLPNLKPADSVASFEILVFLELQQRLSH